MFHAILKADHQAFIKLAEDYAQKITRRVFQFIYENFLQLYDEQKKVKARSHQFSPLMTLGPLS